MNICRTWFFWPAKFIHQNQVIACILTGAKEHRIQVCVVSLCELFVSNLTIECSDGGRGAVGELLAAPAHVGKPRVRAGVRNGVSASLQDTGALLMWASQLEMSWGLFCLYVCYLDQHVSWQINDSCVPPLKKNVLLVGIELSQTKLCLEIVVITESYCLLPLP